MAPVLVSAVIPAYNAERHLAECLASVTSQRGAFELEVIVVDDGSKDRTAAIARGHDGVQCIVQPNGGPSKARNVGIAAARGEFVAFLDADDLWPEGKLAAQLQVLQQQPQATMIFGDCRQFDAGGFKPRTEFEAGGFGAAAWGPGPVMPQAYARLLENNVVTTGSVVARRAALQQAGGFAEDLRLVEDLDLWLRLARAGAVVWTPMVCLLRRRHDSNISRDADAIGLAFLEVLRRHAATWHGDDARALGVDAARLASREYLNLAELARRRGDGTTARQRLWRSVAAHPSPRTQWQAAKMAVKLLLGRTAA